MKMNEGFLRQRLLEMVSEDVGLEDITTAFTPNKEVSAEIIAKQDGIVSGMEELTALFGIFGIDAKAKAKDGARVRKSQRLFFLKGNARDILTVERTALNLCSRMSGISTLTKEYVDAARKANPRVRVAATRKTAPMLAFFDKKAVLSGGGDTHRLNLEGEVLIKDNHLKVFGDVRKAVLAAKKETSFAYKIEIEVSKPKDAVAAAASGADIILLDNMPASDIKKTVALLKKGGLRDRVLLEASGGVTLGNIPAYARTGVDVISVGRLTNSAPAFDLSLEVI